MRARSGFAHLLWIAALLIVGCDLSLPLSFSPSSEPTSTDTAAATATAHLTATIPVSPSPEPPAATLTPGSHAPTPSAEAPGPIILSCRVISQSIRNGSRFGPKERFDIGWKVRNNSGVEWNPDTIDFTYYSGTKMYVSPSSDLEAAVPPGDTVALVADLVAPRNSGTYTTVWTLRQGQQDFCHVSLTIVVP